MPSAAHMHTIPLLQSLFRHMKNRAVCPSSFVLTLLYAHMASGGPELIMDSCYDADTHCLIPPICTLNLLLLSWDSACNSIRAYQPPLHINFPLIPTTLWQRHQVIWTLMSRPYLLSYCIPYPIADPINHPER